MAIQLQDAYDELANLKQDLADVGDDLFISWANHVNRHAYRYIQSIDPERFILEQNFTNITSGAQNLPNDFDSLQPFCTGIFYIDNNGVATDRRLALVPFGSSATGYYLNGSQIVFLNINTNTDFVLRYIPKPPTLTAMTDYFTTDKLSTGKEIIPTQYLLALRDHLDVLYSQWDEDINYESVADARWVRELNEIGRYIKRTPAVYAFKYNTIIF